MKRASRSGSRVLISLLGVLGLLLLAAPARAEGLPVAWGWTTDDRGLVFEVEALDLMDDVRVEVRRHVDGQRFSLRAGQMGTGAIKALITPMPTRTSDYTITITARYAQMPGRIEDVFDIAVLPALDFEVDESTWDEERRFFELTMTQPAGSVELVVRSDTGDVITERTIRFNGEPPGTRLPITWVQGSTTILSIDVKVVGPTGEWTSRRYIPWRVEFDPALINFATGSAEIPQADEALLLERLAEIQATAARVSEWVDVELYVAGYTDTVGSAADNRRLSESRARSIGQFFRANGIRFPIFVQGFGEDALAVPTEDNVDEPQNRRSIFVLTTQTPPPTVHFPRSNWQRLP